MLSALLALCEGNPPVGSPHKGPLMHDVDICESSQASCLPLSWFRNLESTNLTEFQKVGQSSGNFCGRWLLIHAIGGDDNVMTWPHFPLYWPFVMRFHWWGWGPLIKGQWNGDFCVCVCTSTNVWTNSGVASDLGCHDSMLQYCNTYILTLISHNPHLAIHCHQAFVTTV